MNNESIGIIILVIAIIVGIGAIGFWEKKKYERNLKIRIRRDWGYPFHKGYKPHEMEAFSHYYLFRQKKEPSTFFIDDITWNDLDMDQVFSFLDRTYSSVGRDYLLYMLRSPQCKGEILEEREKLISFFQKEEPTRFFLQSKFFKMGHLGKYSLMDYMELLLDLKLGPKITYYLPIVLLIPAIIQLFFTGGSGLIIIAAVVLFNIVFYFRRKGIIGSYVYALGYLIKILNAADEFEKISDPELSKYIQSIKEINGKFSSFKRGAFLLSSGKEASGDLAEMGLEYVRFLTHIDLIKFYSMAQHIRGHQEEIGTLVEQLGILESTISIASVRKSLPNYTVPILRNDAKGNLHGEEMYHPLLLGAVPNSIHAERGVLITGSNASGKSTFLKTVAINALFAQTIHTCLAASYDASYFRIASSMSLRDSIESGESYYMVEIKALKRVISHAKEPVPLLCFLDEVLRGTNTVERIAASSQILKSLTRGNVICFCATHDIELTSILEKQFDNYHFEEEIKDKDILFSYHLYQGKATTRNAIMLLQVIGYDAEIIQAANAMAKDFVETGKWQ